MTQRLVWPADLQRQEDGSILVSFPDIPEALTEGATEAEALMEAQDCVIAALGGYVEGRHPIPAPSPVRGRTSVALPVLVAAKIALYGAMHEQGVSNTALAERLGLSEGAVRRLIDLDHRSHIGRVETALHALGRSPDGCHASGVVRGPRLPDRHPVLLSEADETDDRGDEVYRDRRQGHELAFTKRPARSTGASVRSINGWPPFPHQCIGS